MADTAIICDGDTITIIGSNFCNKLIVGEGNSGTLNYVDNLSSFLFVQGDIEVKKGARIEYTGNGGLQHFLDLEGNFINTGTVELISDADDYVKLAFLGSGDSKIDDLGGSWELGFMLLSKNSKTNSVIISGPRFSKALTDGAVVIDDSSVDLRKGTLRHNNSAELGNIYTPGKTVNDSTVIPANVTIEVILGVVRFPVNNTVFLAGTLRLEGGVIIISSGIVGPTTRHGLVYRGNMSEIIIKNGFLSVKGAFKNETSSSSINFTISGGGMSVGEVKPTVETFKITDVGCIMPSRFIIAIFEIKNGGRGFDPRIWYEKDINAYRAVLKDKAVGTSGNVGNYGDVHNVRDFCYDVKYKPSDPGFVADINLIRHNLSASDLTNTFYMGAKDKATCFFAVVCESGIVPCNPPYYPILDYTKPASLVAEKESEDYPGMKMIALVEKNVTLSPNPVDQDILTVSWDSPRIDKKELL